MKERTFICWALRDDDELFYQGGGYPDLYATEKEAERDIRNPRLSPIQVEVTVRQASKLSVIKSRVEIEAEIAALHPIAKDFDTEKQSNDTCIAAGAHDALRWLLGLAEDSISETLKCT